MGYPEYILVALYVWSLVRILRRHGEPMHFKWHAWVMCFVYPILLAWGGFFSSVGIPQVIYTIIWTLSMGSAYLNRGKTGEHKHNFYGSVIIVALMLGLYWWGGFFS